MVEISVSSPSSLQVVFPPVWGHSGWVPDDVLSAFYATPQTFSAANIFLHNCQMKLCYCLYMYYEAEY